MCIYCSPLLNGLEISHSICKFLVFPEKIHARCQAYNAWLQVATWPPTMLGSPTCRGNTLFIEGHMVIIPQYVEKYENMFFCIRWGP